MKRFSILVMISACSVSGCQTEPDGVEREGLGSYFTTRPAGLSPPLTEDGTVAAPLMADSLAKPVSTHDWWSSLLWPFRSPFSGDMWAHPLVLRAEARGLLVGYPTETEVSENRYFASPQKDLLLSLGGLTAPETRVADYGDWSVTAEWPGESVRMRATFGRGLPFVWVEGGAARVEPATTTAPAGRPAWSLTHSPADANVDPSVGAAVLISIGDHFYGAFLPAGHEWTERDGALTSDAPVYSVAVLPDGSPETMALFRRHAMQVVRDTRVSWGYESETAKVSTRFDFETEHLQTGDRSSAGALAALYRHQWLHTEDSVTDLTYVSPRGTMRLMSGAGFATSATFGGVLPRLPDLCLRGGDATLNELLEQTAAADDAFSGARGRPDTYWSGKAMGRLSGLISLARSVRMEPEAAEWNRLLADRTESWLSVDDTSSFFFYDETWRTLVGHPASFESETELNDHHFHYGYHIQAAAQLARQDTSWARGWGPMVELLIKDVANPDRSDSRFPFLRSFDPYAGHGIAGGHSDKVGGYDQESSSESMNFAAAVMLWGLDTGDDALRDLGIWLYTTERTAIEQYWFDIDNAVFPETFDHVTAGIVWGRGAAYETWWSDNPANVHGINYLPLTGASYYLGRHPDWIRANDGELARRTAGVEPVWQDLSTMFYGLADPAGARARFDDFADSYQPEEGESPPHTHQWLSVLEEVGRVDTTLTSNFPSSRVFHNGSRRAYAAYNPSSEAQRVRFSDGAEFQVPPRRQITVCR